VNEGGRLLKDARCWGDERSHAELLLKAPSVPVDDGARVAVGEDTQMVREERRRVGEQVHALRQDAVGVPELRPPCTPGVRVASCKHRTSAPAVGSQAANWSYMAPSQAFSDTNAHEQHH
jgi:hypothetical protein